MRLPNERRQDISSRLERLKDLLDLWGMEVKRLKEEIEDTRAEIQELDKQNLPRPNFTEWPYK